MLRVGDMTERPWHQALAYAVTGRHFPDLGLQERADLAVLAADLRKRAAAGEVQLLGDSSTSAVPADLRAGLGAAQFAAALAGLRAALDLEPTPHAVPSPGRPLTADERRLLADVPPHHGS